MDAEAAVLTMATEIGPLTLRAEGGALTAVEFGPISSPAQGPGSADPVLVEATRQLAAFFAGELEVFDLPLRPSGTTFQLRVWQALRGIPYGETVSYGEVARRIGRPGASRAVGRANGQNPIAIVMPCHRVIGADGTLTGYGGGLDVKRRLLALEAAHR